jgi:hypothetical protein
VFQDIMFPNLAKLLSSTTQLQNKIL